MKNGLIVTLYGNYNYGNKLQNYATQLYLESKGINVNTLIFGPVKRNLYRTIRHGAKIVLKDWILKSKKDKKLDKIRRTNFLEFDKLIKKVSICNLDESKYNYMFIGSDQVWNSNDLLSRQIVSYVNSHDSYYVSVSASIGNDRILPNFENDYSKQFKKVNHISVREYTAKKVISDLTDRNDIEVLLDPTMLVSVDNWNDVIKKPKQMEKLCPNNERYILIYFLGNLNDDKKDKLNDFAEKHNCKIINILDRNDPFYVCGPDEFLWLEKNAFFICTDSFHSAVFAILFHRPFLVFERDDNNESMNSRLLTLLHKFNLEERFYKNEINEKLLEVDYSAIDSILSVERKKASNFFEKALKCDKEEN